jgi:hypothetical protein
VKEQVITLQFIYINRAIRIGYRLCSQEREREREREREIVAYMKGMKIASISVLLCLTIPLLLVILLYMSLSLSGSKQDNPFLPTYELVVAKRSCRVAVFFMSNVIIITIVRGSSAKPSAEDSDCFPSFHHFSVYEEGEDGAKDEAACGEYYFYYSSDVEDGDDEYHGYDGYEGDNDDDGGNDDDDDSEDDDHHQQEMDLERRIEEFIAKNYKQRREETVYERLLCSDGSRTSFM